MARNLDIKEEKVLVSMLKSGSISDHELAKRTGLSQPTVSRIRNRLEHQGIISQYQVVPSLATIGLNLMTFTMFRLANFESRKRIFEWAKTNPKVAFASEGEGMKENVMIVSIHPTFDSYQNFLSDFRSRFSNDISDSVSFVTSTDHIIKDFNMRDAVEEFLSVTVKRLREKRQLEERSPRRVRPKSV